MPTFFDSTADTAEASEALRGLAHASRGFDQPAEMYGVIGDLSSGVHSLRQALDQIADVHERKAATLSTTPAITKQECETRSLLRKSCVGPRTSSTGPTTGSRKVSSLRPDRLAPEPAVEEAALENGYVYDEPDQSTNDRVVLSGDYALVVNPHVGYASLLRRYTEPEAQPQEAEQVGPAPVQGGPELLVSYSSPGAPKREASWFEPAKITAAKQTRGWCVTYF